MRLVLNLLHGNDMCMGSRAAEFARDFLNSIPQCKALGMELVSAGDGVVEARMPYRADLVGDPDTGVIAGGAVSVMMDTCGGAAVLSHAGGVAGTATLDLRIDYMRGATPGQTIRARATCYHMTRHVAFVRALAWDDDERPIATATGSFTVDR